MYNPYDKLIDKIAYIAGVIILIIGITAICIIIHCDIDINKYTQPCILNKLTGLYCPGCGGTRALKYLLSGRIFTSLYCNPIVVYVFFPWIWLLITHSVEKIRKKFRIYETVSLPGRLFRPLTVRPWYLYTGIIVVLLQCLIKNILYICFSVTPI
ncbi:MAG: DUF2752 domain-containing protein [Lachnospiraceae bacterium]|nr:DUF2752 domain-containing protein [Lachnospiraceae bacterium]